MNEVTLSKKACLSLSCACVSVYLSWDGWGGGGREREQRVLSASVIGFSLEG